MSKFCLLALDPGKSDFAWCIADNKSIIKIGMFKKTVYDIRQLHITNVVGEFVRQITNLLEKYPKIDEVVVERFQPRPGRGGGANAEYINIMNGIIALLCIQKGLKPNLVQASTWKNHMSAKYDTEFVKLPKSKAFTKSGKPRKPKKVKRTQAQRFEFKITKQSKTAPIKDHEFDAVGIAQWRIEIKTKKPMLNTFKKQLDKLWEKRSRLNAKAKAEAKSKKAKAKAKPRARK